MKMRLLLLFFFSVSQLSIAETTALPPTVSIFYINSPFCYGSFMPGTVSINGTGIFTGGTFSSTSGLVVNATTGEVNVSSSTVGNYTVTYTIPPNAPDPAVVATANVIIVPPIIPTHTQIGPVCLGSQAPALPTTSTNANAITGTWSPSTINTSVQGTVIMTFTPNPGQCAVGVTMSITVMDCPTIITPSTFATCDNELNDNDGYYLYPLNVLIPGILGGQNPSNFTVTFHQTQNNAQTNTNPIANVANYQTQTQTIWIRVTNNTTGSYNVSSFNTIVEQYPTATITTTNNSNIVCVDYVSNNVLTFLTLNAINSTNYLSGNTPPTYSYQWYVNGVPIVGATNANFTIYTPLLGNNTAAFVVEMTSQSMLGCSQSSQSFTVLQSGQATPIGIGYSIVNNSGIQTITIEVQGYGIYQYAIDNGAAQSSPVFTNVALGTHLITVTDLNGCGSLLIDNIIVNLTATPTPTGNTTQSFNQGATLANIQVSGQNIQWYSASNKNVSSIPLPLNTVLVNGITYFASQKIGGYESTSRLPVLVQIALSNSEFESTTLSYSPNPVIDNLTIKSKEVIKTISVYSVLGQLAMIKSFGSSEVEMNLSELNQGVYFVKIDSETLQNTFKIIKQ